MALHSRSNSILKRIEIPCLHVASDVKQKISGMCPGSNYLWAKERKAEERERERDRGRVEEGKRSIYVKEWWMETDRGNYAKLANSSVGCGSAAQSCKMKHSTSPPESTRYEHLKSKMEGTLHLSYMSKE